MQKLTRTSTLAAVKHRTLRKEPAARCGASALSHVLMYWLVGGRTMSSKERTVAIIPSEVDENPDPAVERVKNVAGVGDPLLSSHVTSAAAKAVTVAATSV